MSIWKANAIVIIVFITNVRDSKSRWTIEGAKVQLHSSVQLRRQLSRHSTAYSSNIRDSIKKKNFLKQRMCC